MARYGLKMTIYQLLFFGSSLNLHGASGYIFKSRFRPLKHLKMTVRTSVLWKINTKNDQNRSFIKWPSFPNRLYLGHATQLKSNWAELKTSIIINISNSNNNLVKDHLSHKSTTHSSLSFQAITISLWVDLDIFQLKHSTIREFYLKKFAISLKNHSIIWKQMATVIHYNSVPIKRLIHKHRL